MTLACLAFVCAVATGSSARIPAVFTVPHELDVLIKAGHIQGAACSTQGVYLAHQLGIEKIGWDGRHLKHVSAPSHLGDCAYANGRIYGAFVLQDAKSRAEKRRGMVRVWDEDLNTVAERRFAEALDGIVVLGDTVYVGVDRWGRGRHPGCCVKRLGLDLTEKDSVDLELGYEIAYGVQTMATDGQELFFGCYGGTSRVRPDLSASTPVALHCSEGFDRVPRAIADRETPVFFVVKALGGNMQGWRKDPANNPPRIRLDFYEYAGGAFKDVTARPKGS